MSWAAALGSIGAGLVGAGGAVGGGLLAGNSGAAYNAAPGIVPGRDPVLAASALDAMMQLGIFDPSIMLQASPLNQALAAFGAAPMGEGRRREEMASLQRLFEIYSAAVARGETPDASLTDTQRWTKEKIKGATSDQDYTLYTHPVTGEQIRVNKGEPTPERVTARRQSMGVQNIASQLGIGVKELFDREIAFRNQIGPQSQRAAQTAETQAAARQNVMAQLSRLAGDLPGATGADLASLQEQEKARILRELNESADEQGLDMMRQANMGNFNPGRGLGEIEKMRLQGTQDANLNSLAAATALLSGRQSVVSNQIALLRGLLDPAAEQTRAIGAIRVGAASPGQIGSSQGNTAVGQGVTGAANALAGSVQLATLLQQMNRPTAPTLGNNNIASAPGFTAVPSNWA